MDRPGKFEHHQYVGDKRTQVVYDIDALGPEDEHLIDELMAAETYLCFGPDTVAEARNRGYRLCDACPGVRAAHGKRSITSA
jgi:hypothetical protein